MVLVRVRDQEPADLGLSRAQIADVGDHEVDAEHLLVREHQARVDDNDVVPDLDREHVLADLPHATERDDPERTLINLAASRRSNQRA